MKTAASVGVLRCTTKPRFIEIPRERGGGKVPFTEEHLSEIRGGLTVEEYRWKLIRQHSRKLCEQKQQGKERDGDASSHHDYFGIEAFHDQLTRAPDAGLPYSFEQTRK